MHAHVQRTREAIDHATNGLTLDQFTWHPDGKWCTAEILEHLALAYGGTAKALGRVAEGGKSVASKQSFKQRIASGS